MVNEALDLILFFDEIPNKSRQLVAWFKGHVVERTRGNSGNLTNEQRALEAGLTVQEIKQIDKLMLEMNHFLSKYCHPTINAMRPNVTKSKNLFDYEHAITSRLQISPEDFSDFFVVPAINAMLISKNNISFLTKEQADKLNSYRKRIQPDIYAQS